MDFILSARQIRSARSYLGFTQEKVAKSLNVTKATIANWENENYSIPLVKCKQIIEYYAKYNVEFIQGGAFIVRDNNEIVVLKGDEGFKKFFDLVYKYCISSPSQRCCVFGVYEKAFVENLKSSKFHSSELHTNRMKNIKPKMRAIVGHDNDQYFLEYCKYKKINSKYFDKTVPTYIFGNTVGMINWTQQSVIVIVNQDIATAFYKIFDCLWDVSQ